MKTKFLLSLFLLILWSCKTDKENNELVSNNNATVYYGGDILTMVGETPNYVEALVEKDGLIEYVGSSDEAMKIAGKGHIIVNLTEKTKGSLEQGKLADLVILDKNPLKIKPDDIKDIRVLETLKEGQSVFKH